MQSDYKLQNEQISKEMSAAMGSSDQYMMMPERSGDVNSLFYNQNGQSFIYEPSTANFEEAVRSQLAHQMNSANLIKPMQNPSTNKVNININQKTDTDFNLINI